MSNATRSNLYAPAHWKSWLVLALLRLIAVLPLAVVIRLGYGFGSLYGRLDRFRGAVAQANLRRCFPHLDEAAQKQLLQSHFRSLGASYLEMAVAWWASNRRLCGRSTIHGLEYLRSAMAEGRGVLLLSGHFTSLEIAGRTLACEIPVCVTYRKFRDPVFNRAMEQARKRDYARVIHRKDTRGFIRALLQGQIVWYAPDQDGGLDHSVFAPFFGVPAATMTTSSRIARMGKASVLFMAIRRSAQGPGYVIEIAPVPGMPGDDPLADALRFNQLLESSIRKAPEQYLWTHRRFKTRPAGVESIYPPKPRRQRQRRQRQTGGRFRLPELTEEQYLELINGAEVLTQSRRHGAKVMRFADRRIIKLFYPRERRRYPWRRWLTLTRIHPYAGRFARNCLRLEALGIPAPHMEAVYRVPHLGCDLALYRELPGTPLRELGEDGEAMSLALLKQLAVFVTTLHRLGIHFRALHPGNILRLADHRLGLIDVTDLVIFPWPLRGELLARSLYRLLRYQQDEPLFAAAGGIAGFLVLYAEVAGLSPAQRDVLIRSLKRRMPESFPSVPANRRHDAQG